MYLSGTDKYLSSWKSHFVSYVEIEKYKFGKGLEGGPHEG